MRKIVLWPLAATLGIVGRGDASPANDRPPAIAPQASASSPWKPTVTASLTAEDIGRRVLTLIDEIHRAEDISPEHVEKVFGMKPIFNPRDANDYGYGGELAGTWTYDFGSVADPGSRKPTQLRLSFDNHGQDDADMKPVCGLDFDGYAKELIKSGFKASPYYGEHGRLISWNFTRGKFAVTINIRGESSADVTHDCVSMLTLDMAG